MKYLPIKIEGKEYQLFYAQVDGQLLTRLIPVIDENPSCERMPEGENVDNLIFATMLFGKPEALWELKKIVRVGVRKYMLSGQKNQLYCLYGALYSVPGVLAHKEAPDFLRQLNRWFAEDFPEEGSIEFNRLCDVLRKEAGVWGGWKTPVRVNEWKNFAKKHGGIKKDKLELFVSVAMETFLPLNALVKELRKK